MKVCVVHDELRDEKKRKMVESVIDALSKEFYVGEMTFDEHFMRKIKEFDFVFNLSTGGGKETRQIHVPAILDILNIPYTGSNAFVHALCMDKITTKIILKHHGVKTPNFVKIDTNEKMNAKYIESNLKYPMIVKPSKEGSAVGLRKESVVWNAIELERAIKWVFEKFDQSVIVEEFIDGKELSVGIIGNDDEIEVLPILEIDFSNLPDDVEKFYSYRVKNEIDHYLKYYCPARIDESIRVNVMENSLKAYKILNLKDYARFDIRVKEKEIYILEVNSLPLLVPIYSDIIKMAEAKGYEYDEFILKILKIAMKRVKRS